VLKLRDKCKTFNSAAKFRKLIGSSKFRMKGSGLAAKAIKVASILSDNLELRGIRYFGKLSRKGEFLRQAISRHFRQKITDFSLKVFYYRKFFTSSNRIEGANRG
jgi:hypothetical protein